MKRAFETTRRGPLPALLALSLLGASCHSQKGANEPGSSESAKAAAAGQKAAGTAPATPERNPAVLAALERMGTYLRSLPEFAVRAEAVKDEVLDTGQKVQFTKTIDLWVRRPNALRADVTSDRQTRQFFYDGKTFTLYAQRMGYYATIDAPPNIRELIDAIEQRGIEMPLVDLFDFGTDRSNPELIRSALYIGPAAVLGVLTDQYAFRQDDVDWQVWVERGERPLPRKLVITTTEDSTQPQYAVVMNWNLNPVLGDDSFAFVPPPGAHRIVFEQTNP